MSDQESASIASSYSSEFDDELPTQRSDHPLEVPPDYHSLAPSSTHDSCLVSALNVQDIDLADLWTIRLPSGLKPKHLSNLSLDLSSIDTSGTESGSQKVAEVKAGNVVYDVFAECIPNDGRAIAKASNGTQELAPETKEALQLLPLLPDQNNEVRNTHIVAAPKQITKVIFFRRQLSVPENSSASIFKSSLLTKKTSVVTPKTKRPQPPGLEARNIPFGANSPGLEYNMHASNAFHTQAPTKSRPITSSNARAKRLKNTVFSRTQRMSIGLEPLYANFCCNSFP
ncbi:hypothetical protein O181_014099 [Austropuccinia psidii MF-1]|uniref:Uncharacterized protein n=1 Tax=Austropuccinia psidii MF-1 TaxID=1389203 RepID=A0A9Q3GPI9_9BASI|nr:hypothetical protein [Austropuccinia psidii MF-1]